MYLASDLENNPKEKFKVEGVPVDLDFTIINPATSVPSLGRFYPTDRILVRGLRFREQQEIANISGMQDSAMALYALQRLYRNCIAVPEIPFDDILTEDFVILSTWISYLTNPDQKFMPLTFECIACGHENKAPLNMFGTPTTPPDFGFKEFTRLEATTLETSVGKLLLAPITIKDVTEYRLINDEYKTLEALYIKRKDGQAVSIEERINLFGYMATEEVKKYEDIVSGYKSAILPVKKKCSACGKENEIDVSLDLLKGTP